MVKVGFPDAAFVESALAFAHRLADVSGEVLRRCFQAPLPVHTKADASPVTQADMEAEAAMRALIMQQYPEHGIFGEEGGRHLPQAEWQWVLDPIDGTRAFIAGYPTFTTLIALCYREIPVLGLIHQPILRKTWEGITTGASAPPPRYLAPQTSLQGALIATTSTAYFTPAEARAMAEIERRGATFLREGDAYAYAMLAEGRIHAVIDAHMKPYDYCALAPIVTVAGGIMTDWQGSPITIGGDGSVLATQNLVLHTALRALVA